MTVCTGSHGNDILTLAINQNQSNSRRMRLVLNYEICTETLVSETLKPPITKNVRTDPGQENYFGSQ